MTVTPCRTRALGLRRVGSKALSVQTPYRAVCTVPRRLRRGDILPVVAPCPFCDVEPARVWIENQYAIAFPDAFPVADGHTLIVPRRHVATIYGLTMPEQEAIWDLVGEVRERLLTGLKPDGFNIGFNDGLAAGQTVEHAHVHVIPRRRGDVPDPRGGMVIADNAPYLHNIRNPYGSDEIALYATVGTSDQNWEMHSRELRDYADVLRRSLLSTQDDQDVECRFLQKFLRHWR